MDKNIGNGLSSKEVEGLISEGKTNYVKNKSSKSVPKILASNIFTYFNAIFFGIGILLVVAGTYKNLISLIVIVLNVLIGIFQQLRAKSVLDKLALLDVSEYKTIRDGEEKIVKSPNLVLGDLIILESGQQIPADAVVISGEASVNESLLTGEQDEVNKIVGSELLSGSFVISGRLYAKLTRVGKDSYAQELTEKAKEIKERKSEMIMDIEKIIRVAGILIIPIGAILLYQSLKINGNPFNTSVSSMVGAIIGMIPEGLYLLVTVSLSLSTIRLARKKVLLHDMRSIETLARVDVLCVDKTGTITSDVMTVTDVFGYEGETEEEVNWAKEIMSRYVYTIPDNNITMRALRDYFERKLPLDTIKVTPFNSKLKHSEIVTKESTYRLGAPEYLLSEEEMKSHFPLLDDYINCGKRLLVLVSVKDKVAKPILFLALRNDIRDSAKDTFDYFQRQGLKIKVISGDNPLTVSEIAKEAGIRHADKFIDATTLETKEDIKRAVREYTVFGRVKPEQKKQIVEAIKESGQKVAMTGDGVNDILAMKEADCSIAMSAGSDAARQAAQVVLLDNDFSHMKDIIYEGRRNINNITRSATLFLYKNIFSLLLAVFSIVAAFNYPLQPTQISMISAFNIGLPAFLLALEKNEKKQKGRFLDRVLTSAIPAALTSFFAIIAMIYFAKLFNIAESEVATASIYLVSVVGFSILYNISRPLNKYRIIVFIVCILGIIFSSRVLSNIFDIENISAQATALCVVFAIAEMTIIRNFTFWLYKLTQIRSKKYAK